MKLNLGCGKVKIEGYINCDISKEVGPDKVVNLEHPLPWKDNSIEEIIANNVLEHIQKIIPLLNEMYRVCKDKARIKIFVPHYASRSAWSDLTHIQPFSWSSFEYVNNKSGYLSNMEGHEYGKIRFNIKKKFVFGRLYNFLKIFPFLANKFSSIYETFFVYIFAPIGIKFELEVVK